MPRRLAAVLAAVLLAGCSNGAAKPRVASLVPSTPAPALSSATPSPSETPSPTPSPTPSGVDLTTLDGLCTLVSDGSEGPLPGIVHRVLGVTPVLDDTKSKRYANAEICRFVAQGKKTPYVDFYWGSPDALTYDQFASSPTRRDEPSLPYGAYTFVDAGEASVVLKQGADEASVSVAGLGDAGRAKAVAIMAAVLKAAP